VISPQEIPNIDRNDPRGFSSQQILRHRQSEQARAQFMDTNSKQYLDLQDKLVNDPIEIQMKDGLVKREHIPSGAGSHVVAAPTLGAGGLNDSDRQNTQSLH